MSTEKAAVVHLYSRQYLRMYPHGLEDLPQKTKENEDMPITDLYPDYKEALQVANILPPKEKIPTVKKLYEIELKHSKPIETTKADEQKADARKLYSMIGHSPGCVKSKVPVHSRDTFKARMMQHFNDVSKLMSSTKPTLLEDNKQNSDTFAKRFTNHFPQDLTP
eukprot:12247593-Ditylum_brightwellii.AAC.1